ncbi:hypothetical protein MKW98_011996 [Papaver atlanticum]|uniref:PPM-type phosphatase domain-containing protein n=1 Tax=Papaver atlanticum TaxID=357466 RepID=A0AAD4SQJ1_9MAGN|nr:hypothetical protein MKW98_011996 [Papaver atlanticum]
MVYFHVVRKRTSTTKLPPYLEDVVNRWTAWLFNLPVVYCCLCASGSTNFNSFVLGLSSGSCCVTCLIEEKDVIVSNLGDCMAVLFRGGVADALTRHWKTTLSTYHIRFFVEDDLHCWSYNSVLTLRVVSMPSLELRHSRPTQ